MLLLLMNMGFAGGGSVIPPVDTPAFDGGWANYPEAREAFRKARLARESKKRKETPDELHIEIDEPVVVKEDTVAKRSAELARVSEFLKNLTEASDRSRVQALERQAELERQQAELAAAIADESNAKNLELGKVLEAELNSAVADVADEILKAELEFVNSLSHAKTALENSIEGLNMELELNDALVEAAKRELEAQLNHYELMARVQALKDPDGSKHLAMLEEDDEEALLLL